MLWHRSLRPEEQGLSRDAGVLAAVQSVAQTRAQVALNPLLVVHELPSGGTVSTRPVANGTHNQAHTIAVH